MGCWIITQLDGKYLGLIYAFKFEFDVNDKSIVHFFNENGMHVGIFSDIKVEVFRDKDENGNFI